MKKDLFCLFIIFFVSFCFFAKLFFPSLSLFATPDFGQSDIWQLNLPLKFFLSQSLKSNQIPLWSNLIASGFPILAEGQIGAFNLQNLILFKFLPFVFAYNLSYVFIFSFTSIGTYFYLRTININRLISFFSAISFSFSGFFVTHISHFNLIQTASFLPWMFLVTEKIAQTGKLKYYLLFSFFLSQQLFSGFPQVTFITLLGISSYLLLRLFLNPRQSLQGHPLHWPSVCKGVAFKFGFFIFLGFGLAAVQLFPQYEFLKLTNRSGGLDLNTVLYYSFPLKNLLTFLNPTIWGSPQNGTYPSFDHLNGTIFWETNGFLGFLPILVLPFISVIIKQYNSITISHVKIYFLALFSSFFLMLGKFSPAYVIFLFPPFNFFRVPARFILIFTWTVTILSSLVLNVIARSIATKRSLRILLYSLMIFSLIYLFSFGFNYNPVLPANKVLEPPPTAKIIKSRLIVLNEGQAWNDLFINKGWQTPEKYLFFRNNLKANFNLIYNLPSYDVYPIMLTHRYSALIENIYSKIDYKEKQTKFNDGALKLLSMAGVRYFISPHRLELTGLKKIFQTQNGSLSYRIYENQRALPQAYFVESAVKAETLEDFEKLVFDKNFDFSKTGIVENDEIATLLPPTRSWAAPRNNGITTVSIISASSNNETILHLNALTKGLLVLSDSYYPSWKAYVDNQITKIYPVNINSRGVVVDKGKHTIEFRYEPESFKIGSLISLFSFILLSLLVLFSARRFFLRKAS